MVRSAPFGHGAAEDVLHGVMSTPSAARAALPQGDRVPAPVLGGAGKSAAPCSQDGGTPGRDRVSKHARKAAGSVAPTRSSSVVKLRHQVAPQALVPPRGRQRGVISMQPQRTTLPKFCAHCGAEFFPHPNRTGQFCSRACYFLAHRKPDHVCERCGLTFRLPSSKRPGRFCSRACLSAAVRIGPDAFWAKVNKDGPVPEHCPGLGPCWLWTGAATNGYGRASLDGEPMLAHRAAWKLNGRVFTDGFVLDHLCRTPACVRPTHLEEVTDAENIRRGQGASAQNAQKTHCIRGHDNWWTRANGWRFCRTCRRLKRQERR
jgi:hypothetical protein